MSVPVAVTSSPTAKVVTAGPTDATVPGVDLFTDCAGIRSPNPFWLASCPITNTGEMVARAFDAGWGGVVTKTIGLHPVVNVVGAKAKFMRTSPDDASVSMKRRPGAALHSSWNWELISDKTLDWWLPRLRRIKEAFPDRILIASSVGSQLIRFSVFVVLARLVSPAVAQATPRLVVVGGGPGGATVAKYVAREARSAIDVTLVEPARSFSTSMKSRPDLWTSDGLVVTPSSSPVAASSRISAISAVSAKNFMRRLALGCVDLAGNSRWQAVRHPIREKRA